ncbi:MAG: hypothetical protein E7379_04090 [Clostridiales bacterium]|nr:hypothetical protein [Clostridiales bacterium]
MKEKIIVISILSYYAKQIFAGTKHFEFRKSPIKNEDLNKPVYVYSAKEDKKIIGKFEVSKVHKGNLDEILKITGYDKRQDKGEIENYFKNSETCFALELSCVNKFTCPLSLSEMRKIQSNITMPQYYTYIYSNNPLFDKIKKLK